MPLARVALYQKGITIYISPNTNDNPEWQATIESAQELLANYYEGTFKTEFASYLEKIKAYSDDIFSLT